MADGLPNGFAIDQPNQAQGLPPGFSVDSETQPSVGSQMVSAVTDIPHEIYQAGSSALNSINDTLNPFSDARHAAYAKQAAAPTFMQGLTQGAQQTLDTGKGILAVPELAASPITGASRSAIGHPYSALTGIPYDEAKGDVDTAMMALRPGRGGFAPPSATPVPPSAGPLGVTLSEGQASGELPKIRAEQAALKGQLGPDAEAHASAFADQQAAQLDAAKNSISSGLDQFGQQVVQGPQEAGSVVSDAIQNAAAQSKAGVKQAYKTAQSLPGEIHAGAFEGMGQKIKGDLSLRDDPVIVDDKLTPYASAAIKFIDDKVSNLNIPNKADPFGAPNPENITGVSLKGVDQWRKTLSSYRNQAFSSGNASDGRASASVLDAFDSHVDNAVNSGLFQGDPRAVQAWNDARAANTDYRSTFSARKNDPIGRVVEKIIGNGNNPAAIPNDVADFIYGSSGVNPNSLNVGVANRVKGILGEQSPEWSAVKQGLFSRLVEPPPGMADWGPDKISQRLNRFLNGDGKELSQTILSAPERNLIQNYANLQRQLVIPAGGINKSETSTFVAPMLKKISGGIAALVGAAIGHTLAPGLYGMGEVAGAGIASKATAAIQNMQNARMISRQMPLVATATRKWQQAANVANKSNSPLSKTALSFATANLATSLKPLGVSLEGIGAGSGTVSAPANQNQQQ